MRLFVLANFLLLAGVLAGEQSASQSNPQSNPQSKLKTEDEVGLVQASAVSEKAVSKKKVSAVDRTRAANGVYGSLNVTGVSDFKESSSPNKSVYSQYQLSVGYQFDSKNQAWLYLPMQKDLSRDYETGFFLDAKLSHMRRHVFQRGMLDIHHTTSFLYPATESSTKRDQMYAGFELSPRFDLVLNKYVKGLMLIYIPRYRRRFHKYTANRDGEYLVNQSLIHIFVGHWAFAKKLSFESTLLYVQNRRYDGAQTGDSYMTVQELQYAFNETFQMNVGLQTGGSIIAPERGESKSVALYDANASEFYTGARIAF